MTENRSCLWYFWNHRKGFLFFLIPALASLVLLIDQKPENQRAMRCLGVIITMGLYWMLVILPLPVTSLIPIVAFPFLEIMGTSEVCSKYFNSTMFVFIGGLLMGIGLEEVGLQKRFALSLLKIKWLRRNGKLIMGIFMFVTWFLSMWVSNTATVATMIPLVTSYCKIRYPNQMNHRRRNLLLLSIAYAANIGGTGILTGSPPNLIVLKELDGKWYKTIEYSESNPLFLRFKCYICNMGYF